MEIKEIKKFLEELELVDSDEELGNTYFAKSKEDAYNCLDTMLPGEVTGIYLKHKEYPETQELTIEKLEGDKYLVSLEEDKPEYSDDWEGEGVISDEGTKEDLIWLLNSLLQDYKVVTNKNESLEDEKEYLIVLGSRSYISNKLTNAGFIDLNIENYTGKNRKYDGVLISADDLSQVEMFLQENGFKYFTPEELNESLEGYKTIAKILQGKKGYNVAEEDEPMLTEDQPTLKSLLTNLAKYL